MPDWSNETRTCDCGVRFTPKREDQHYCGTLCRDRAAKRRRRSMDKSGDSKLDLSVVPRNMDTPASDSSSASEWDNWPVCPVCKLWQMLPTKGLPRHLFCIALRKAMRNRPEFAKAA